MGQCRDRPSSHGVDIAECIGGCDLAEGVGVIHHGSKKIHGLHQRGIGRNLVDPGIVGVVKTDQNIRVGLFWQLGKNLIENRRTQLGSAASGFDGSGKPEGFGFGHAAIVKPAADSRRLSRIKIKI